MPARSRVPTTMSFRRSQHHQGQTRPSLGGEFALDQTMFVADLNNSGDIGFATSAPTSTGNAIADFVAGQTAHLSRTRLMSRSEHMAHRGVSAGQLPDHTQVHGQPWTPVGHRYASRRCAQQDGVVYSQPAIHYHSVSADGLVVRGRRWSRSRHHRRGVQPYLSAPRFRMGSVWGRQDLGSRRSGHLLRNSRRQ